MKKNILLLLTTITIITASILTGCSTPALEGAGEAALSGSTGTILFSWAEPGQAGSRSSSGRNDLSRANTIQDARKVIISIEAADGTTVYSQKQLNLYNFNGSFISEPISLKVGSYRLTEYLVLNQAGTVIYATPKEGSPKAHLVADPLPINFTVTKDSTTKIIPEVVDVTEVNPADFGYATFSFAEAKVFNFLVSVMVYDLSTDNFILTDAVLDVSADAKRYSFNLAGVTNNIAINDITTGYHLTIKKAGYEDYSATYTNTEMKGFFQNPLLVTLTKRQAPVNTIITFVDPNLEAAVRAAISKPTGDIYTNDVAGLTKLDAGNRNISNLSGIEQLTSLTELYLYNNSITDITPLSTMTKISILSIYNNRITDISPISSLLNLTGLGLHSTGLNDISALTSLNNLTILSLSSNNITDITPLSSMTNMTNLDLSGNNISDITPLSAMTKLTKLWLYNNNVSDITPLSTMTNMTELSLSGNNISDITPLSSVTNMTNLDLNNNNITNITPLSSMIKITTLFLNNNSITDITPLVNNAGIDNRDNLNLTANPLNVDAKNIHIPALNARGVLISF